MSRAAISLSEDQKRILWRRRRHSPTPRSVLAIHLGMSNSTVTKLSRELVVLGLLEEAPAAADMVRGTGRPVVPLRISAAGGYAAEAEAKRMAANLGLPNRLLEQELGTLSGGQRRRVELARILFSQASTMILDEPTSGLDPLMEEVFTQCLAEAKAAGTITLAQLNPGDNVSKGDALGLIA